MTVLPKNCYCHAKVDRPSSSELGPVRCCGEGALTMSGGILIPVSQNGCHIPQSSLMDGYRYMVCGCVVEGIGIYVVNVAWFAK